MPILNWAINKSRASAAVAIHTSAYCFAFGRSHTTAACLPACRCYRVFGAELHQPCLVVQLLPVLLPLQHNGLLFVGRPSGRMHDMTLW